MNTEALLNTFQHYPPEIMWGLLLVVAFTSVLGMLRLFGEAGLYIYIVIATLAANIQVLKLANFSFYDNPIPLGTVLFSTTYLCTDILNEYYGKAAAKRGVILGFFGFFIWTVLMLMTIGFQPISPEESAGAFDASEAIATLFTPSVALFISAMCAYLISQYNDVFVYQFIKKLTKGRHLWLRNNLSTALSALIDNTVFSVLAWVVLADEPAPWHTVIFTYILGTYLLRLGVAILDTPALYAAKWCIKKQAN